MIEIKLDLNLLRQLIEENSVDLDILGGPYKQRVINARLLLEVIHRAVDVDKKEDETN